MIAERQQVEAELRDNEARVRAIVNTVLDGVITIDDKGMVETFNPAASRIFGFEVEEVVGQNVKMLMPEPYHGGHDGYLGNYLATGDAKVIGIGREVTGRRKDGSTFPMELAVSEMAVAGKRMFTGIVRDITARKQAETQSREMNVNLGQLVEKLRWSEEQLQDALVELKTLIATSPLATVSLNLIDNTVLT